MTIEFKQHKSERLYPIGYTFTLKRGKQSPRDCTVTDWRITHDSNGEVVKFEYVIEYFYALNQSTTQESVPQTTIDIATNNGWKRI